MDIKEFIRFVLPKNDELSMFIGRVSNDTAYRQTQFLLSDSDVAKAIAHITKWQGQRNLYLSISAFPSHVDANGKRGRGSREASAMHSCQVLIADIDCGPNKHYATKAEAGVAIGAFLTDTGLHYTLAVDSGNGFQLYWKLDQALPRSAWQPLATGFDAYLKAHGLRFDPISKDAARILRIPGTYNVKQEPHKLSEVKGSVGVTYDVLELAERFGDVQVEANAIPQMGLAALADNDELTGGMRTPGNMDEIIQACPLMAHIVETGGAGCDEPLWKDSLQLVNFVVDREDWALRVSKGHANYSEGATLAKLAQRTKGGPPFCETLEAESKQCGMTFCATCRAKGSVRSPIRLTGELAPVLLEEEVEDCFPDGYKICKNGIHRNKGTEREPEWKRVFATPILALDAYHSPAEESLLCTISFKVNGKTRSGEVLMGKMSTVVGIRAELARAKFIPTDSYLVGDSVYKNVRDFMEAWTQKLQQAGRVRDGSNKMGWNDARTELTIGDQVYSKADTGLSVSASAIEPRYARQFTPVGEFPRWQRAANLILATKNPPLILPLLASFAAPFVALTGESDSALLSIVSRESGTGKTTGMKVAQSVWGHPVQGMVMLHDTTNSVNKRMGLLHNLPVFWDEVRFPTKEAAKAFIERVMFSTREKGRMASDTSLRDVAPWLTIVVATTNNSLLPAATSFTGMSDSGLMRLFEVKLEPGNNAPGSFGAANGSIFAELNSNYGHAGRLFAEKVVVHIDDVKQVVHKTIVSLSKELSPSPRERLWMSLIASLLAAGALAKHWKIVEFDMVGMRQFLVSQYERVRMVADDEARTVTGSSLLAQFLRENVGGCLKVTTIHRGGAGRPKKPQVQGALSQLRPGFPIVYEQDEQGVVLIPNAELRKWGYDKGISPSEIIAGLSDEGYTIEQPHRTLGAGTGITRSGGGQERCYLIVPPPAAAQELTVDA